LFGVFWGNYRKAAVGRQSGPGIEAEQGERQKGSEQSRGMRKGGGR